MTTIILNPRMTIQAVKAHMGMGMGGSGSQNSQQNRRMNAIKHNHPSDSKINLNRLG